MISLQTMEQSHLLVCMNMNLMQTRLYILKWKKVPIVEIIDLDYSTWFYVCVLVWRQIQQYVS